MSKLRILQIQGLIGVGGSQQHTYMLTKGLVERGCSVIVVANHTPSPLDEEFLKLPIKYIKMDLKSRNPFTAIKKLYDLVKHENIHLIHTHLRNADILGALVAILTGIPFVSTLHGPTREVEIEETFLRILLKRFHALLLRKCAKEIIAISNFVRDFNINDLHLADKQIAVVYNSTDRAQFEINVDSEKTRMVLNLKNYPVIALVGTLKPRKFPEAFLAVAERVIKKQPQVYFIFVGEGPLRFYLEKRIQLLGLSDQVRLFGNRNDMPEIMNMIDILAVTSINEGFGRVITEAMCSGKPVVAFNSGAISEIVKNENSGYVVPLNDVETLANKILYLLENPSIAKSMGANGRQIVRSKFDVDVFIDKTYTVLKHALEN